MHKFFVDEIKDEMEIVREDAKHISKVLRCAVGEHVEVSDGKGREALCEISSFKSETVLLKKIKEYENKTEPKIYISLFQCVPKGQKMEEIINACTQLGVREFIPLLSERTIVRGTAKDFDKKRERWQKVAQSAAQQSKRGIVPQVKAVTQFSELTEQLRGYDMVVFAYEECRIPKISEYLKSFKISKSKAIERIAVIIGCEGGFAPSEADMLVKDGYEPVSLGKTILRAEIAPVIAITAVLYEFNNL